MDVVNGSTDVITYFVLRDSTNHAPKTDVTITDIDLYYLEQGTAMAEKVDATALDAADSAHADNKAYHCGQGLYRIDWPDEAFNGGVGKKVELIVVCTGVDTTFLEVELKDPWQTGDSYAIVNGDHGLVSIQTDINSILDDTGTSGVLVSGAGIDAIFDRNSSLSISFETLINRIYQMINDKMEITDATGAVSLKDIAGTGEIATGNVSDDSTTTTRDGLTWV